MQETRRIAHDAKEALDTRLKNLTNQAPVMVFMKGTKTPRCGFLKQLIAILNETGVYFCGHILKWHKLNEIIRLRNIRSNCQ